MRKGRAEIISLQDNVSGLEFDLYKKSTFLKIVLFSFLLNVSTFLAFLCFATATFSLLKDPEIVYEKLPLIILFAADGNLVSLSITIQ